MESLPPTSTTTHKILNKESIWKKIEDNEIKLNITNVGKGSSRYSSVVPIDERTILLPFGASIGELDLKTGENKNFNRFTKGAVYVILQDQHFFYVIDFSGEVCKIKRDTYELVAKVQTRGSHVRHASLNEEFLAVSCEDSCVVGEQITTSIEIFSLPKLEAYQTIIGNNFLACFVAKNILVMIEQLWMEGLPWNEQDKHDQDKTLNFYDVKEQKQLERGLFLLKSQQNIIMADSNSQFAIFLFTNRQLVVYSAESQSVIIDTPIEGKGSISCFQLQNDTISLIPQTRQLMMLDLSSERHLKAYEQIQSFKDPVSDTVTIRTINSDSFKSRGGNLTWIKYQQQILIFSEGGVTLYNFDTGNIDFKFESKSLTFCGTEIIKEHKLAVCGDMGGIVRFYQFTGQVEDTKSIVFSHEVFIEQSIRSLCYFPPNNTLLIGAFDGELLEMNLSDNKVKRIFHLDGTITSIRLSQTSGKLIATTVKGTVYLYQTNENKKLALQFSQKCHLPVESGVNQKLFGSLHIHADIWNSEWSPCGKYIVTCSEDQMAKVFEVQDQEFQLLQDLTGHSLACTAVDWKHSEQLGNIIVTISDDMSIRVYKKVDDKFKLIQVHTTDFTRLWHTLTYMRFDEKRNTVIVTAQNGHLFIVDIAKETIVFANKIHVEGIEGLSFDGENIITCSSDCSINHLTFN